MDYMDYCYVLSAVQTLIQTAPIHCRGSISDVKLIYWDRFCDFVTESDFTSLIDPLQSMGAVRINLFQ